MGLGRRWIVVVMLLVVVTAGVRISASYTGDATAGSRSAVPDIAFTDPSGATVSLSAWRGKVVLLNFWATWCAPCVKEMPALERVEKALGGPRFEVVTLSEDRGGQDVPREFLKRQNITALKPYFDPKGAASREIGIRGLPTTLLIDAQGREVARWEGEQLWDAPQTLSRIRQIIAEP